MRPKNQRLPMPVSLYGILCLSGAIALFVVGYSRGEMAAIFGSLALFCYAGCALLSVIATRFHWRKVQLFIEIRTNQICINPGEGNSAFPKLCPGSVAYYFGRYLSGPPEKNPPALTLRLPLGSTGYKGIIDQYSRGEYRESIQALIITDPAGFFCLSIKVPAHGQRILIPAYPETAKALLKPSRSAVPLRGKSTFHRSEDLLESRQYQSGDDPRRIHWKAVAHTGELTIRQGELLPPPETRYTLYLQNWIDPQLGSYSSRARLFEQLTAKALYLAENLISRQIPLSIMLINAWGEVRELHTDTITKRSLSPLREFFALPQREQKFFTPVFPSKILNDTALLYVCCPAHTSSAREMINQALLPIKKNSTILLLAEAPHQAGFLHGLSLKKDGYNVSTL